MILLWNRNKPYNSVLISFRVPLGNRCSIKLHYMYLIHPQFGYFEFVPVLSLTLLQVQTIPENMVPTLWYGILHLRHCSSPHVVDSALSFSNTEVLWRAPEGIHLHWIPLTKLDTFFISTNSTCSCTTFTKLWWKTNGPVIPSLSLSSKAVWFVFFYPFLIVSHSASFAKTSLESNRFFKTLLSTSKWNQRESIRCNSLQGAFPFTLLQGPEQPGQSGQERKELRLYGLMSSQ